MLSIKNLYKSYGKYEVWKDVNLDFDNGIYVLLAPNGAGKTTLLKMMATLLEPTKGEITYEGNNIINMGEKYRDFLGYLPQKVGYYKNYSAIQNLKYLAVLKDIDKNSAIKRIEHLISIFGLEEAKNKKMKAYSGGMVQRVGIIGALLNNPKILILDEPTAGLDPKERVRFKNIISDLAKDRIIIVSTHITSDIEFIANRIIMIKDKRVLYNDSVANICNQIYGSVFETVVPLCEVKEFHKKYYVFIEQNEGEHARIRFYNNDKMDEKWIVAQANLEDVFMYEYKDNLHKGDEIIWS